MAKIFGTVLLIVAGCLAGCAESYRLKLRAEKLEAFLRFLSAAKTEIRYASAPVESVIRKYGGELCFLSPVGAEHTGSEQEAWQKAVASGARREGFSASDAELLSGFGKGFGASDTEGQIALISLYENLTEAALQTAREDLSKKAKLYRMLGLFGGTAAAILLF